MASTIDRTQPPTNDPLVSADIRNGVTNAAANDIEALQTGKEDVGTADAAVSAHNVSGVAHGANIPTTTQKAALDAANSPSAGNAFATAADLASASGGHVIQNTGTPVPQRGNLNFSGNGVDVQDNVGNDASDVIINNAVPLNVGGGAEVVRDVTGTDPVQVNFRSIVAGVGATVTQLADTIQIDATGVGGGEINTQTNIGAGIELGLLKNGVDLPIRTLDTGQFETNGNQVRIQASTYADFATAAAHYGTTSIHFPVSDLPGAGLIQVATAIAVGAGTGITVNADDVAVSFGGNGSAGSASRSDHTHSTSGLDNNSVTNAKLADMTGGEVKLREGVVGDPQDTRIDALSQQLSPTSATRIFAQELGASGFVQVPADALGGASVTNPPIVDGDLWTFNTGSTQRLPVGSEGQVFKVSSGLPGWVTDSGAGVTNPPSVKGDLWTFHSANTQRQGVGADGTALVADSAQTSGLNWKQLTTADVTNAVGATGSTVTDNVVLGDTGAKDVKDSGIAITSVLQSDASATITSGYRNSPLFQVVPSTYQPDFLRNFVSLNGSGTVTVTEPAAASVGMALFHIQAGVTIVLSGAGWIEKGTDPGGFRIATCSDDGISGPVWSWGA